MGSSGSANELRDIFYSWRVGSGSHATTSRWFQVSSLTQFMSYTQQEDFVASVSCRTAVLAIHTVHTIPSGTTWAKSVMSKRTWHLYLEHLPRWPSWETPNSDIHKDQWYFLGIFPIFLSVSAYFMLFLGAPFQSFPPMLIYGSKEYLV